MLNELGRIRKEAAVAYTQVLPRTCLVGLLRTTKTSLVIAGPLPEVLNQDLSNTKEKCKSLGHYVP